jgi:hypothetical protein
MALAESRSDHGSTEHCEDGKDDNKAASAAYGRPATPYTGIRVRASVAPAVAAARTHGCLLRAGSRSAWCRSRASTDTLAYFASDRTEVRPEPTQRAHRS